MIRFIRFADFVEINPKVKLNRGEVYPFIDMAIVEPRRRYVRAIEDRIYSGGGSKFSSGDVLFARITPCLENGKIVQFKGDNKRNGFGSTEFFIFRAKNLISDPAFIYYLVLTDTIRKPAEKSMSGASGRQRANLSSIVDIKIPQFPLSTQQKITAILSLYDDLIDNNTRRIKILEEIAQAIYHDWFVNFHFPGHESVPMEESELGLVPEGWDVVKIEDIYQTGSGATPSREIEEYYGGSINWVKTKELKDSFIFDTEEKITESGFKNSSTKLYPENTVLIAMYGATIGMLGILGLPSTTNQACCAILQKDEIFSPMYIFLNLLGNRSNLIHLRQGAAQQNVNQIIIKNFKVLKPSKSIMIQFNQITSVIFEQIKTFQQKNAILHRTRDLLLPKLISGEVDVSELDIRIPEA